MISQKQINSWLPTAIELFNKYMPGLNTDAILFQIVSPRTAEKTRAKIVEELGSYQDDGSPNSLFEFIFGSKGTAILMKQQYVKDERQFREILWHELGHAYAYQHEYPGTHLMYMTVPENQKLWEISDFIFGYVFWKEFIAESISCFVSNKVYPVGDISDNWYPYKNRLENYLNMALNPTERKVDTYTLAFYFSHLLMGDGEKQFFEKAIHGCLVVGPFNDSRLSAPGEVNAHCLHQEEYRKDIERLHKLLIYQTSKPDFWSINPNFITECGNCIFAMVLKKAQETAIAVMSSTNSLIN